MNMKRLREPGHAQFLFFLFVVLHFYSRNSAFWTKSDSRYFFHCKHGNLSPCCPQRINENNKGRSMLYHGVNHIVSFFYYIQFNHAVPHRIHCSTSAPSRPCPSCIRSDTLHHGWNLILEEYDGEMMSSKKKKGMSITPQDYQSQNKAGQDLNHVGNPDLDLSLSWKANLNHSKVVDN